MIKKTRRAIKNCQLISFFFLIPAINALSATPDTNLKTADSLFQAKKYTESFELYENLFKNEQMYSPAMLLKMSFIKEGLGDYSNALYYLHIYFKKTLDKDALIKIAEIVDSKELKGYDTNSYVSELIYKYLPFFKVCIIAVLFMGLIFSARYAGKGKSPVALIIILVLLIPLSFAMNNDLRKNSAIVIDDSTYLMEGPSGSANVAKTITKGHKVTVIQSTGVWSKINWEGKSLYVRKNKIKEII